MAAKVFNLQIFKQNLQKAAPAIENSVFNNTRRSFEVEKRITLGNFNNHPVTVELDAGPDASPGVLSYGNLYSLLGFTPGKDLTGPIYDKIENDIQIRKSGRKPIVKNTEILFQFQYTVPTFKDIEQVSEIPPDWATKPWVRYIEEGIPYFAYYIYSQKGFPSKLGSRSGHGLQKQSAQRAQSSTKKIPYVKEIINNFISRIKSKFGV